MILNRRIMLLQKCVILRDFLKKSHMMRNAETPRSRIITLITLVLRTITKKNAHNKM